MRTHTIELMTTECAAVLASIKTILDAYIIDEEGEDKENVACLKSAVLKIVDGMGLPAERHADVLAWMVNPLHTRVDH